VLEEKLERDLVGVIQRRLIAGIYSNSAGAMRLLVVFVGKPVGPSTFGPCDWCRAVPVAAAFVGRVGNTAV
jgi:hypothetical protein